MKKRRKSRRKEKTKEKRMGKPKVANNSQGSTRKSENATS